jgi:flagellum-specific peptidoglycan hydrolase FlgJ
MSYADSRLEMANLKFARSTDRLARMIDSRADREERQARADAAQEAQERRDRARKAADRCAQHQLRYDSIFQKFGQRAPQPIADSAPPDYRRRLYAIAQTLLPSDHELAGVDPHELGPDAIIPFEAQLFEALSNEAENPSSDNLPETIADSRAKREVIDPETGLKTIEYRAKNSFIREMSRPARRVLRFIGKDNAVLFGPAWSKPG